MGMNRSVGYTSNCWIYIQLAGLDLAEAGGRAKACGGPVGRCLRWNGGVEDVRHCGLDCFSRSFSPVKSARHKKRKESNCGSTGPENADNISFQKATKESSVVPYDSTNRSGVLCMLEIDTGIIQNGPFFEEKDSPLSKQTDRW